MNSTVIKKRSSLIECIKLNQVICIILFIGFMGCTKDINIDILEKKYQLVINSTIAPFTLPNPKTVYAKISKSIHIFDTTLNTEIPNAQVYFYCDGLLTDTLTFIDSIGLYVINKFWFPQEEKEYSIKVEHSDYKTASASSIIPQKVVINDTIVTPMVIITEDGDVFNEVSLTFTDPADIVNYYEIALSGANIDFVNTENFFRLTTSDKLITKESYYPPLERFDIKKPKYLLFNDKTINGKKHTLRFSYSAPHTFDGIDGNYMNSHFITVHLRSITKEYYLFKTTLIQHTNNQITDILYGSKEPDNVFSNIKNGYGLFSGFSYDLGTMYIKQINY